jgi:prepilin signal peptidase PulO-like enzyme (type II secretory pathway)
MDHALTSLASMALLALGVSMAVEDHRTTRVALWKLVAFTAVAVLWAATTGALAGDRTTALVGLAVGAITGVLIGFALAKHLGRDAFGGADTWILAAGGALLGLQWVGPWLGLATVVGLVAFAFFSKPDPEHPDGRAILPFVPTLLATLLALAVLRGLAVLPPTIL